MNLRELAIINYARKVAEYPKGHLKYDPIDLINLQDAYKKYDKEKIKDIKSEAE